jgi:hypothetical protein
MNRDTERALLGTIHTNPYDLAPKLWTSPRKTDGKLRVIDTFKLRWTTIVQR